ncbi:serine/threonine protein kinase [Parabacteroides pacaensis]|uniref:serine/threonine protein kinase n=1 Tax=Parabacteroides pacaensis TaxID=2086575 RepID=UPI001F259D59|nr:serine/threonine-protein kinase [Parabacteroides pacaensis]
MQLQSGTLLQGSKYKIEFVLGQGGFGITYLGWQTGLNRRVAIKEFFMKEYCNRNVDTSYITIGTEGSRELVDHFRQKFIKEAQSIAGLNHPNIVRIHDVFEENNTAYYVMEYIEGGSLQEYMTRYSVLQETEALHYIREIAGALDYIHQRQMSHLDVKPGNILRREEGDVVLIDFGLSKRYDKTGQQTSITPVGISSGYAPMEQYVAGGVQTFTPATDIYSLGATLYKLLTGETPPDANVVFNDGLPALPANISAATKQVIRAAMQPQKQRLQNVQEFLGLLDKPEEEDTIVTGEKRIEKLPTKKQRSGSKERPFIIGITVILLLAVVVWFTQRSGYTSSDSPVIELTDSINLITAPLTPTKSDTEQVFQLELKAGISMYNKKQYESAKDLFIKMKGKHPKHRTEIKQWIDKCNSAIKEKTETATTTIAESKPQSNRNELTPGNPVDLGLSVKWAAYNVGASSPEEYGGYYGWADPTGKKSSTNDNDYPSANPPSNISGTQYDIAHTLWKGKWRLPTQKEFHELSKKCTWKWIRYKGIVGYMVTGPNGNRIFLPASGYHNGDIKWTTDNRGRYWSGTLDSNHPFAYTRFLHFDSDSWEPADQDERHLRLSVRPVSE